MRVLSFLALFIFKVSRGDQCPNNDIVNCVSDPCSTAKCTNYPTAKCKPNYCRECSAHFYLNDAEIDCNEIPKDSSTIDEIIKVNEMLDDGTKEKMKEGDIMIPSKEKNEKNSRKRRGLSKNENVKWKGGIVPYVINNQLGQSARSAIAAAHEHISQKTCIKFKARDSSEADYVEYVSGSGCSSWVGRIQGRQSVSIGRGCEYKSIVVHEILHALGFYHEQNRPDRDEYVKILWENIDPRAKSNFQKQSDYTIDSRDSPYDKQGIMHYSNTAFRTSAARANNLNTIESKGDKNERLGGATGLTDLDTEQLNDFYQCNVNGGWSAWGKWSPCEKDDFEDDDEVISNDVSDYVSRAKESGKCHRSRVRTCTSPEPTGTGKDCGDDDEQTEECDTCSVNGQWSEWGSWGTCSKTCGSGWHTRMRSCNNPSPSNGGRSCPGDDIDKKPCNQGECPATWGRWTSWSGCRVDCKRTRERACFREDKKISVNECKAKDGEAEESEECKGGSCSTGKECPEPKPVVDQSICHWLFGWGRKAIRNKRLCKTNTDRFRWWYRQFIENLKKKCPKTCGVVPPKPDCNGGLCSGKTDKWGYEHHCPKWTDSRWGEKWCGRWFMKRHCEKSCCELLSKKSI